MPDSLAFLRRHLCAVIVFSIFSNLVTLLPSLFLLQIYDRVLSSRSVETLWMLVFISILGYAFSFGIEYARQLILSDTAMRFAALCREQCDPQQLLSAAAGRPALGPANDVRQAEQFLSGHTIPLLLDAPWGIVFLLIIFLFDVRLGAVAMCGALLIALVAIIDWKRNAQKARLAQEAYLESEHASRAAQSHAETIVSTGATAGVLSAQLALRTRERFLATTAALSQHFYKLLGKSLQGCLQTAMLAVGAALVIGNHASGGVMLAATILLGRVLQPLQGVLAGWQASKDGVAAVLRLRAWLSSVPATPASVSQPQSGQLVVEGIVFGHANALRTVLTQVSFCVAPGDLLFVRGACGSGKSTLARLLAGLHRPFRGSITLDGVEPHTFRPNVVRECIGFMPQDSNLLPGTIAENIGRTMHGTPTNIDQQAVEAAARLVGIHAWIMSLPAGYKTAIGPGGHHLTHGECRFIELARCVYGTPKLAVLDEPAAWLDEPSCQRLQEAVQRMLANEIAVVILAVQPPFSIGTDQTAILHQGRILQAVAAPPDRSMPARLGPPPLHPPHGLPGLP